jgi:hypothetical protein
VLGSSCIVTPIPLLKRRHHPLLRTNCRKIQVLYRQVRRRRAHAWTQVFPAWALAMGDLDEVAGVAADEKEVIFLYGFSMAVSPFGRLGSPRSRIVEKRSAAQRGILSLKPQIL